VQEVSLRVVYLVNQTVVDLFVVVKVELELASAGLIVHVAEALK
jgi:hypothetical protein